VTLAVWAAFVRDAVCYASAVPELAVWASYRSALERWAEDLTAGRIIAILERILEASEAVAIYAQPRLAFEAMLLDIFAGADSPPRVDASLRAARRTSGDDAAVGRSRRKPSARRG
jgi:DNA polymerase III gamma/tau subunit